MRCLRDLKEIGYQTGCGFMVGSPYQTTETLYEDLMSLGLAQLIDVEYERGERFAGESKYPLGKMVTFAFEGITSLSVKPIRMITIGGLLICLISLIMLIKSFVDYFNGNVVPGWASIMVSIWVLGGLQIFAIGIIGEYIGKTYLETKKRPKYVIESVILN